MPIRPVWGRLFGLGPRRSRVLIYGVILAGVGLIATFGVDLTILATAWPPETAPVRRLAPPGGALVICGGGAIPERARNRFVELAGGPRARILVIPTAHAIADGTTVNTVLDPWKDKGAASVQLFHTRSHEMANDVEFVRPLTEATGVWFGGGRQSYLIDAYLGTEVERQLTALLDRGGVIGGNSAGAAVMTRVMITGGRTTASVGQGFDFFPGAVVDQHFLKRNRLGRLLSVLSDHPDLIGLGIDERTALVVNVRSRILNVIGDSYVVACVPGPVGHPARLEILKPGDEANFSHLKDEENPSLGIAPALDLEALEAQ
jgi:cyanophycinase